MFEATLKMVEHKIGSLAVVDAEGSVKGIVTERDYLRKVLHQGRTSKQVTTPTWAAIALSGFFLLLGAAALPMLRCLCGRPSALHSSSH